jgi:hypothetical protein
MPHRAVFIEQEKLEHTLTQIPAEYLNLYRASGTRLITKPISCSLLVDYVCEVFEKVLIKERDVHGRLIDARRSEVAEFVSFSNGLTADLQAMRVAPEHEWSNGQVEGHVHRLKMIKRQMYGRGNLDLLRAQVLRAA